MSTLGSAAGHWPGPTHAGGRVAIAAYLGSGKSFDNAVAAFAESYVDQNERDYDALKQAAAEGRLTVQSGL